MGKRRLGLVGGAVVVVGAATFALSTPRPSAAVTAAVTATAIPLGDGHVTSTPKRGSVDSCRTTFPSAPPGPTPPWINTTAKTWNSQTKVAVAGAVEWPAASYSVTVSGTSRHIVADDLPIDHTTGVFPIAATDPAYAYDHNPNHIAAQRIDWTLPADPTAGTSPSCTDLGPIGILDDGVLLYNALDADGRDAVAHEVQDACAGHPDESSEYHHHDVPPCILSAATGRSTLVGYAIDGYGIYVERNARGSLLTNGNLDACHGRTSTVTWNGRSTRIYHYDATLEYPYTVGCFHGTPLASTH